MADKSNPKPKNFMVQKILITLITLKTFRNQILGRQLYKKGQSKKYPEHLDFVIPSNFSADKDLLY